MHSVAVLLISFLLYSISHSEPDPEDPLYDIDNYYVLIRHPIVFDVKDINITAVVDYAARQSEFEVYNRSGMVPPPFEDFPFPRLLDEHATYVTYPPESEIAELMHLSTKPGPSEEKPEKHQESTDKAEENHDKDHEKSETDDTPMKHSEKGNDEEDKKDKKELDYKDEEVDVEIESKREAQDATEKPEQENTDPAQVKSEDHKLSHEVDKPEAQAALEKPAMKQVIRARRHLE